MVSDPLRRVLGQGWLLGAGLAMALSLGALSDCLANRPPPPPPVTPTPVPPPFATSTPVAWPTPVPTGSATVGIGQVNIPSGQRALVPITVTDVTNPRGLGGYNLRITFDPAVVQVVSVAGGEPPFGGVMASNVNNQEGWVLMTSVQVGTMNGPRGPITVANLEVEAVGAWGALATLGLDVTELIDPYGDSIAATAVNGEVWVR